MHTIYGTTNDFWKGELKITTRQGDKGTVFERILISTREAELENINKILLILGTQVGELLTNHLHHATGREFGQKAPAKTDIDHTPE